MNGFTSGVAAIRFVQFVRDGYLNCDITYTDGWFYIYPLGFGDYSKRDVVLSGSEFDTLPDNSDDIEYLLECRVDSR
jgi:hypothetical protein